MGRCNDIGFKIAPRRLGVRDLDDLHRPNEVLRFRGSRRSARGYTLVEVMIVSALLALLIITAAGSIGTSSLISKRSSDYTAALTVVQAKLADIRAATYNPPNSPFGATAVTLTKTSTIALDQAGVSFAVTGTVTSKIEPVASGHLVTVTGTFQTRRSPITVSLQTVVNKFSAGQQ